MRRVTITRFPILNSFHYQLSNSGAIQQYPCECESALRRLASLVDHSTDNHSHAKTAASAAMTTGCSAVSALQRLVEEVTKNVATLVADRDGLSSKSEAGG